MAFRRLSTLTSAICRRTFAVEAGSSTFPLTFASPTKSYFEGTSVRQVDVPSTTGHFGILPFHVPTIAVLLPGVITVYNEAGDAQKFFVSSGTTTIHADSTVHIVSEEICDVADIDAGAARAALEGAVSKLNSASSDEDKAAAQIEIDVFSGMVAAV